MYVSKYADYRLSPVSIIGDCNDVEAKMFIFVNIVNIFVIPNSQLFCPQYLIAPNYTFSSQTAFLTALYRT